MTSREYRSSVAEALNPGPLCPFDEYQALLAEAEASVPEDPARPYAVEYRRAQAHSRLLLKAGWRRDAQCAIDFAAQLRREALDAEERL